MRRTITRSLLVVLALVVGATTQAFAQGSNPFDIDGTVTDAQNAYPAGSSNSQALPTVDPNSSTKELGPKNASTTKIGVINSAPLPMLDTTNPNAQVDLNRVYATSAVAGSNLWFYFGWVRDSNSGSGFISIELQKNAPPVACAYATMTDAQLIAGCNPWAGRQDNDILILWDQQGNGTAISYRLYNAAVQAFGPVIPLDPSNAVATYSSDHFRGEVAVNINAIVASQQNQCLSYANIIPGTVTGNSDTADYKDTVLSLFPLASNCGQITVNKVTLNGLNQTITGTGPFPYTITAGTLPIFGGTVDSDCTVSGSLDVNTCSGSLAQGGSSATISNLLARTTYTLTEGTIGSQWQLVSIFCGTTDLTSGGTFSVPAGGSVSCTITNKQVNGTLIVIKHVINDNGGTKVAGDFTLSNGVSGASSFAGEESPGTSFTLPAGTTFNVSETELAGYAKTLTGTCSGTIQPNSSQTCTVTNDDIAPSLHLHKTVNNTAGGTATGASFTLTATGAVSIVSGLGPDQYSDSTFQAGSYTLSESTVTGYSVQTDWACSGPGGATSGSPVTIKLGEAWTCTIVNKDSKASPTGSTAQKARLNDTMTITGIRSGAPNAASATVVFRLFSEPTCTTEVYSETVGVTGGAAATTTGYLTTISGSFYWTAVYSGDDYNNGVTKGCGTEITTVNLQQ